jgi:hypothetical protein
MPNNVQKLTPEEKEAIIQKSPIYMPTNPTQSGYTDAQVKQKLSGMVTDEQNSVLAALDKVVDNVNTTLSISVGNVVIFSALPVDLTPYEDMYILIKDANNNITNSYFVDNGIAVQARFGTASNIIVSNNEPPGQLTGDLWYDIVEP